MDILTALTTTSQSFINNGVDFLLRATKRKPTKKHAKVENTVLMAVMAFCDEVYMLL